MRDCTGFHLTGSRAPSFPIGEEARSDHEEGLGGWGIGPVNLEIAIGARFERWRIDTDGPDEDAHELPALVSVTYPITHQLGAQVTGSYDFVTALAGLAGANTGMDAQLISAVHYSPLPWVTLSADLNCGQMAWDVGPGVTCAGADARV